MSDRYTALLAWVEKWQIKDGYKSGNLPYSPGTGSVGLGWLPLLDELAKELIALGWNRKLGQVKEKFGGLRFYIGGDSEASADKINKIEACVCAAEQESYTICEDCGGEGSPRKSSWIRTLCDACNDSRYTNSPWHNV